MLRKEEAAAKKQEGSIAPLSSDLLSHTLFGYLDAKSATGVADAFNLKNQSPFKESLELHTLQVVTQGDQDAAEKMLENNPHLSLTKSKVTDHTNRTFTEISPWQYTCWALDFRMAEMMISRLYPAEKITALEQLQEVDTIGVEYTLTLNNAEFKALQKLNDYGDNRDYRNCDTYTSMQSEKHFDIRPFVRSYELFRRNGFNYWLPVGFEQRRMPAHFLQEYCRVDIQYDWTSPQQWESNFNLPTLPRKVEAIEYSVRRLTSCLPTAENKGLGYEYTLYRSSSSLDSLSLVTFALNASRSPHSELTMPGRQYQAEVLKALHQARIKQFDELKKELENEVKLYTTARIQRR
jgi:hypothetical protein